MGQPVLTPLVGDGVNDMRTGLIIMLTLGWWERTLLAQVELRSSIEMILSEIGTPPWYVAFIRCVQLLTHVIHTST